MSTPAKPSIVFGHGVWADGSCFSKLIPELQAEGYQVTSAQYGLDTPESDVAAVLRTLGRVSSPAILVGHSYAGSVITSAATDDRVAGLVYIAALAPDETETPQSQQDKFPVTDVFSHLEVADGRVWMLPSGIECFAGDLPEEEQKVVWATQFAPAADLFGHSVPGTAWRTKPSWYVVATDDRTIQPDLQRSAAKRMGAATFKVASSHVVMLSQPPCRGPPAYRSRLMKGSFMPHAASDRAPVGFVITAGGHFRVGCHNWAGSAPDPPTAPRWAIAATGRPGPC